MARTVSPMSWLAKIKGALSKTRESLAPLETLATQRRPLDRDFWDEFEEVLIAADFGMPTTEKILDGLHLALESQRSGGRALQGRRPEVPHAAERRPRAAAQARGRAGGRR